MFRQRNADKLTEERFTTPIGEHGEEFELRPMDLYTRPGKNEAFEAIALMKTPTDWSNNIIPFLTGLRGSNYVLNQSRWEWLVRKAGAANALGIMLEAAKQSPKTGFRLNNLGVVKRYFIELHRAAQNFEFKDLAVVDKCLRLATQAVMLMESPEHAVQDPAQDPKRRPFTIGVLLELSAARALLQSGKDEGGAVAAYAQRLLAAWPLGAFDTFVNDWTRIDEMMQENVAILNGMRLALKVDGTNKRDLKRSVSQLQNWFTVQQKKAPEAVRGKPTVGYRESLLHVR